MFPLRNCKAQSRFPDYQLLVNMCCVVTGWKAELESKLKVLQMAEFNNMFVAGPLCPSRRQRISRFHPFMHSPGEMGPSRRQLISRLFFRRELDQNISDLILLARAGATVMDLDYVAKCCAPHDPC